VAIYCENVEGWQREWLENFEAETGFEPKLQDELDAGEVGFIEVATENVTWFENWMQDTYRSILSYPDEYIRTGRKTRLGRVTTNG